MAKELRDDSDYIKTKLLKHSLFVDSTGETLTVHRNSRKNQERGVGYK